MASLKGMVKSVKGAAKKILDRNSNIPFDVVEEGASSGFTHMLGEAVQEGGAHAARSIIGGSPMIGVMQQMRDRYRAGTLFDFAGSGVPFSATGTAVMGFGLASTAAMSAKSGYDELQTGVPSGQMVTATPAMSYTQFGIDAGATGDLVFAMNRNRRG